MRFKLPWTVCRLCLREGKMYPLFRNDPNINDQTLSEKIALVCDINIAPDKSLPMEICSRCSIQLNSAYEFRLMCKKTDHLLQMFLRHKLQNEFGGKQEALVLTLRNGQMFTMPKDVTVKPATNKPAECSKTPEIKVVKKGPDPLAEPVAMSFHSLTRSLAKPLSAIKQIEEKYKTVFGQSSGVENQPPEPSSVLDDPIPESTLAKVEFNTPIPENIPQAEHMDVLENESSESMSEEYIQDDDYDNNDIELPKKFIIPATKNSNIFKKITFISSGTNTPRRVYRMKHFPNLIKVQKSRLSKVVKEKKEVICELCGHIFKSKNGLAIHMRNHRNERPYKCELCSEAFIASGQLTIHMLRHTGERPFACNYCNRRFMKKVSCVMHERIHTGEKPYCCDVCSASFAYSCSLKRHKLLHGGDVKPFICNLCGKCFRLKYHLTAHLKTNAHATIS